MEKSSATPKPGENMDAAKISIQDVLENQVQVADSLPKDEMFQPKEMPNAEKAFDTESNEKQEAAFDLKTKEEEVCPNVGAGEEEAAERVKSDPCSYMPDNVDQFLVCAKCNVFYTKNLIKWKRHVEQCQQ